MLSQRLDTELSKEKWDSPLQSAVFSGDLTKVKFLLAQHPGSINETYTKKIPATDADSLLAYALLADDAIHAHNFLDDAINPTPHKLVRKYLLPQGEDILKGKTVVFTLLDLALANEKIDVARYLCEKQCQSNCYKANPIYRAKYHVETAIALFQENISRSPEKPSDKKHGFLSLFSITPPSLKDLNAKFEEHIQIAKSCDSTLFYTLLNKYLMTLNDQDKQRLFISSLRKIIGLKNLAENLPNHFPTDIENSSRHNLHQIFCYLLLLASAEGINRKIKITADEVEHYVKEAKKLSPDHFDACLAELVKAGKLDENQKDELIKILPTDAPTIRIGH